MNTNMLKGKWDQLQGKVKIQWAKLTNDDLMEIAGKRDELIGKLEERYGYSKEEAEKEVSKFFDKDEE